MFTVNHALYDGWSLAHLMRDLVLQYEAEGDASALPHVRSYRDFDPARRGDRPRPVRPGARAGHHFGTTVTGRPPELTGADDMVGLFISSLPVRVRYSAREPLAQVLTRLQKHVNHDPKQFSDPQRLDVARDLGPGVRHLAFGSGSHYCTGAGLAELETEIVIDTFLLKNQRLELAVEPDQFQYFDLPGKGTLLSCLPVRF
ncbi:cytochrome P450 [Streptomyces sp. NRRL B-1347]|uniref:cytochrome P450 n=1 Tax=Streptomyces sp. NRRL B-1347 TaxID=1476877 RepID=UPI0004C611DF|nr:cytochrome P450 [Streptomyces sp. NRRL B-1347]